MQLKIYNVWLYYKNHFILCHRRNYYHGDKDNRKKEIAYQASKRLSQAEIKKGRRALLRAALRNCIRVL